MLDPSTEVISAGFDHHGISLHGLTEYRGGIKFISETEQDGYQVLVSRFKN